MALAPAAAAPASPTLEATGLVVGYGGRGILPPIDLAIRPREAWALVGRNGSGKSTLLRTLLGLQPRVSGALERRAGAKVSYVPQRGDYDTSVPSRVVDIVRSGLDRGWSFALPVTPRSAREAVRSALTETRTLELAQRRFAELSEGQKQRVLIARAVVSEPDLVVLDEPTSAMDPMAEEGVFELLGSLRERRGLALLVATHQMALMPRFASHVVLVDADDGLVLAGEVATVMAADAFTLRYGAALGRTSRPASGSRP
jgi:zinc transport system ATP-binding protein